MNFTGKICPYCKTEFKEGDDIVVCSVCEMPHHKECWIENKACTTFGCTGTIVGAEQYTEAIDNKTFCTKCGAPLSDGQKFCSSCGTPANQTGEPRFQVAGAYSTNQPYQNTYTSPQPQHQPQYSAPQYNADYNPYGQTQEQVDPDLFTFLKTNQTFYIQKFQKLQLNNSNTSWNWCSFFLGAYWFAYRKMYGIAAAYIGISFFLRLIPELGSVLSTAMSVCSGLLGNYLYQQYINKELQIAKTMDVMNKNIYISKKGGTSAGAAWITFGILVLLGAIIGSNL